ncbi:hypothetical protein Barb4_00137 [Bacteroidales bacterium Barb4]|nr:hypothetical protein Barb4_00137 [Bacteroidales bacterium Barb4]
MEYSAAHYLIVIMRHLLALSALCFSLSGTAQTIYYVSLNGNDHNSGIYQGLPVTLYAALSKAEDGDTICIAQGHYYVNADRGSWEVTKSLTIIGGYDGSFSVQDNLHGNASTVLHGRTTANTDGANKRVMNIAGSEDHPVSVTIENLTMTDGNGYKDRPTIIAGAVKAGGCGGGLFNYHAETVLRNVIISNNWASDNSDNGYGGGIFNAAATLTITGNSVIQNNNASKGTGAGYGGGIYNSAESVLNVDNSFIQSNKAVSNPRNPEAGYGGGLLNGRQGFVMLNAGTVIKDNSATVGTGEGVGGGIMNDDGLMHLSGVHIDGNIGINNRSSIASGGCGGIYNEKGMLDWDDSENVIKDNIGNTGSRIEEAVDHIYNPNDYDDAAYCIVVLFDADHVTSNRGAGSHLFKIGNTFTLTLTPEEHLKKVQPTVTSGDRDAIATFIDDSMGIYRYSLLITGNATVQIHFNERSVTLSALPQGVSMTTGQPGKYFVAVGSTFRFTLKIENSYKNSLLVVIANDNILYPVETDTDDNTYQYSLVINYNTDIQIRMSSCTITLADPPKGIVSMLPPPGEYIVTADSRFDFALKTEDKFKNIVPIVTTGGNTVTQTGGDGMFYYSIRVVEDAIVQVIGFDYHTVTIPNPPEGISVNPLPGSYYVPFGTTFDLVLTASDDTYNIHEFANSVLTANGDVLQPLPDSENGVYRYSREITESTAIQFNQNFHMVTLPERMSEGVSVSPQPGNYFLPVGSPFEFTLTMGGKFSSVSPSVSANNDVLLPSDREDNVFTYTLPPTYDHVLVQISANYHTVTLSNLPRSISASLQAGDYIVPDGGNFIFTLRPDEIFHAASLTVTTDRGLLYPVKSDDETYTVIVSDVTKDMTLIPALHYEVTIHPASQVSININSGKYSVLPGSDFSFMLKSNRQPADAPSVTVNGDLLNLYSVGNGGWHTAVLSNILQNIEIRILPWSDTSSPLLSGNAVKIYSRGGRLLVIESPAGETPVTVCTLTGRIKAQRKVTGTESITLPAGIYIVKAGTEARKIAIH